MTWQRFSPLKSLNSNTLVAYPQYPDADLSIRGELVRLLVFGYRLN
jgi:hypothetical protein